MPLPITCPACNKANQTEPACARCGCDLSRLRAVAEAASVRLSAALACCAEKNWPAALAWAQESWRLYSSVEAARLACLTAAAAGDTPAALAWHARADRIQSPPAYPSLSR